MHTGVGKMSCLTQCTILMYHNIMFTLSGHKLRFTSILCMYISNKLRFHMLLETRSYSNKVRCIEQSGGNVLTCLFMCSLKWSDVTGPVIL